MTPSKTPSPVHPSDEEATSSEENEQVILLTKVRLKDLPETLETPRNAKNPIFSASEQAATTPDMLGVQEKKEEEEVLLLTQPSSRMHLVEISPSGPTKHTLINRTPSHQGGANNTGSQNGNGTADQPVDVALQTHASLPSSDEEPQPNIETDHNQVPFDDPEDIVSMVEMDLYSTLETEDPIDSLTEFRVEETSEAELMLDLLGESATQTLTESQSVPFSSDSEVSLSQISAYLEEDDGDPIATFQKTDFRPSHEYLHPPEANYNPNYKRTHQLQVLQVLLAELTQHCARACCFLHKDGLLIGIAAMGKGKIQERIEDLLFPTDAPSVLSHSIQTQKPYHGMLHLTAMDQIITACLGGALPRHIAVTPVIQNGRAVAIFYMDDAGEDNFPQDPSVFENIVEHAADIDFRWSPPSLRELLSPLSPQTE